ncbi:MAG: hypothetical protein ACK2UW_22580 [Anaerolineales bacterium]|jgi:hypothetical protein
MWTKNTGRKARRDGFDPGEVAAMPTQTKFALPLLTELSRMNAAFRMTNFGVPLIYGNVFVTERVYPKITEF